MRKCWTIASLSLIAISAGCASQTASKQPVPPTPVAAESLQPGAPQQPSPFQQPFRSAALATVPVPNLIPPTSATARLPEVSTGRPDPFAALLMTPTIVATRPAAPVTSPIATVPVPAAPISMAPPAAGTLPTFQSGEINSMPPATAIPLSMAEAIEISGVVQAGSKTSIILKVPDEQTSRYASVGERLASGRVLIKRVEMGSEPVVILEQDGREFVKSIGSSSSIVARKL
jgi:hypothetical protein